MWSRQFPRGPISTHRDANPVLLDLAGELSAPLGHRRKSSFGTLLTASQRTPVSCRAQLLSPADKEHDFSYELEESNGNRA